MNKLKLLIATKNPGKIKEIRELLHELPIHIVLPSDIGALRDLDVEEKGETFADNARLKAQTYARLSGLLTLAEDSGLVIDALQGRPGISSHRYAQGSDQDRTQKILKEMENISAKKRSARFVAAVAVCDPQAKKTKVFQAETEGRITTRALGKNGFGYDPIFFSRELDKTFAQAKLSEKNAVSHRGRALMLAKRFLSRICKSS